MDLFKRKKDSKKRATIITVVTVLIQVLVAVIIFCLPFLKKRTKSLSKAERAKSLSVAERAQKFKKKEEKEVKELVKGKQSFGDFCQRSLKAVKDFFIPGIGNDHRPHALRPKSLLIYLVIALLIKTVATGLLFLIYPSPAAMTAVIASKIIELTNSSRQQAGLAALNVNASLTQSARAKGQDMLARGYFSHDTPEGKKPWQWISKAEYDYVYAGENLALDFTSAEAIQAAFLKSPSHRKNILNPKYQDIGVAVISGLMNNHQTDLLVVFFGTQRQALASAKTATVKSSWEPTAEASPEPAPAVEPTLPTKIGGEPATPEKIQLTHSADSPRRGPGSAAESSDHSADIGPSATAPGEVFGQASEGIIVVSAESQPGRSWVDFIIEYSNIGFMAFIIFVATALLVNILVKIKVQHAPLILQSLVVIALLTSLILVKFHFVEEIAPQMMILG